VYEPYIYLNILYGISVRNYDRNVANFFGMFSLQDKLLSIFFKLTLNQSSYHFISTSTHEKTFHTYRCQTPLL